MGILLLTFIIAVASLVFSFFKRHRNSRPLFIAAMGFALFVTGKIFHLELIEILFSVVGGLLLVTAHYINYKLTKNLVLE
jgi:Na+-transporting NADH:ubiquinone oxidoreductase subunit NqrB